MKLHTTAYSDPLHLPAEAWLEQKKIHQYRKISTRHTIWAWKISPLLLYSRWVNYRSQTTGHNILKRCSNIITEPTLNSATNTWKWSENHIKAWTRSIHSGLAIYTKPQQKQWCRNTRYAVKYQHNTDNCQHTRMYDNAWAAASDLPRPNTCIVSRNQSYKAGLNTKIKYNKTSDHIEILKIT